MAKTLKDLIKAAVELNEVLGLSPEIETEGVKEKVLLPKVEEAAEMVDLENDEITLETLQTLKDFDIEIEGMDEKLKPAKGKEKAAPVAKKAKMEVVEEDEDEDPVADDEDVVMEEVKKSVKEKAPKKEEKAAPKEAKAKSTTITDSIEFLTPLISKKKYTQKELIAKVVEETGIKESSAATLLTDGRNPKYNRFAKLIKKGEDGILSF